MARRTPAALSHTFSSAQDAVCTHRSPSRTMPTRCQLHAPDVQRLQHPTPQHARNKSFDRRVLRHNTLALRQHAAHEADSPASWRSLRRHVRLTFSARPVFASNHRPTDSIHPTSPVYAAKARARGPSPNRSTLASPKHESPNRRYTAHLQGRNQHAQPLPPPGDQSIPTELSRGFRCRQPRHATRLQKHHQRTCATCCTEDPAPYRAHTPPCSPPPSLPAMASPPSFWNSCPLCHKVPLPPIGGYDFSPF